MGDLYFISVFIHILAAAVWIGGMIFMVIVLLPAIKNQPAKAILIQSIGLKFRTVGWIILILLLITGLFNMNFRGVEFSLNGMYVSRHGRLILFKLIIFSMIIIISAIHDFYVGTTASRLWIAENESKKVRRFRFWARWVGRINLVLALIAMGIGIAIVRGF